MQQLIIPVLIEINRSIPIKKAISFLFIESFYRMEGEIKWTTWIINMGGRITHWLYHNMVSNIYACSRVWNRPDIKLYNRFRMQDYLR